MTKPVNHVIEADIKSYFDNVSLGAAFGRNQKVIEFAL